MVLLCNTARKRFANGEAQAVALVLNASEETTSFRLPKVGKRGSWRLHFSTNASATLGGSLEEITVVGASLALLIYARSDARYENL